MISFLLSWKECIFFADLFIFLITPWGRGFRKYALLGFFVYLSNKPLIANFHPEDMGWWMREPASWITAATWVGAAVISLRWFKGKKGQGVWNTLSEVSCQPHLIAISLILLAIFLFNLPAISPQFKTQPDYSFVVMLTTIPLQYLMGFSLLRYYDDTTQSSLFPVLTGGLLCVLFVSLVPLYETVAAYCALLRIPPSTERAVELIGRWEGELKRNTVPSIGSIRLAAYGRIGDLRLSVGDFDGARQGYKKAVLEDPDDATGNIGVARLLIREGILEKAREFLRQVIDCNPSLSWGRLAQLFPPLQFQEIWILAEALEAEGRQEEAFRAYREAWQMRPEDPLVNLGLGRIYSARGDYEKAIAAFQKTLVRSPRHLCALSYLIDTYEKEGRLELAQHYRDRILRDMVTQRISPSDWQGRAGGNLYWNAGCHARIKLLRGKVLLTIQARGTPAQGVWPHMVVMLDKKVIGETDVRSGEWKPYPFTKDVQTGEYTLWVYFTNDFCLEKDVGGEKIREDRNLFVGAGEMLYVR